MRYETALDVQGTRTVFQMSKSPYRDALGRVAGLVGIATDITSRKATEEALAASEAFARSILEASPDCVKTLDLDGRLRTMNGPGMCLLELGAPDDLAGADWPALWAASGVEAEARAAVATARAGRIAHFQGFRPTALGTPRSWDVLVAPVRDAAGTVVQLLVVSRDVTAQHHAALERERLLVEAKSANAAKGQFLASMSHELRTPLNAIAGHVQLVEMGLHGPVTHAQLEALGRVQQAQRHLLGLITDILNHAKLEAGQVEFDVREVPLADVVRDVVPFVEPQLAAKGLVLTLRLPEERGEAALRVWADREKLAQVVLNLLANAVKFTPGLQRDGTPGRISVELAAPEDRPGLAYLRVHDTGIGVPRDLQDRIFEPFVQVRTGYAQATDGTGLGLAISRDFARGMGGDVRVRSTEGEGATFTVSLRRVLADG